MLRSAGRGPVFALAATLVAPCVVLGQGGGPDGGVITPLAGGFTLPVIELDFDLLPSGPVTVGDIQAAFPTAALTNITLTPPTAAAGELDSNTCGRALAGNPDGSLNPITVDPPSSDFSPMGVMIVELAGDTNEAGIEVGNWRGSFTVEIFDDGASVGSYTFDTADPQPGRGVPFFFQSSLPFDEIRFSADPRAPDADWVACTVWLPESAPTMPPGAYLLLVLLLLGVSALSLLRRV